MNRSLPRSGASTRGGIAALLLGLLALSLTACAEGDLADGFPGDDEGGCSACHGSEENPAPPVSLDGHTSTEALGVGAHQAHLQDSVIRAAVGCRACHEVPATVDAPGHIDERPAELTWGSLARLDGANPTWNRDAGTCSSVYCHGATLAGGTRTEPVWTEVAEGPMACDACHGNPPPPPHPQSEACQNCHPGTVNGDGTINVAGGQHIDGRVQAGGTACNDCHGNEDNAAPPVDLSGSSDPTEIGVGAHQAHLMDGQFRLAMRCNECHVVPDTVDAPGHIDALPAELEWGDLATAQGADPAWNRDTATCSSTYCHGATLSGGDLTAPVWTNADATLGCGSCHGNPPPSPHPQSGACQDCHPGTVTADGSIDLSGRRHINGVVDVTFGDCSSCHGSEVNPAPPVALDGAVATTDPGVGAHQAHLFANLVADPVACNECHVVPETVEAPGHLDEAPADLVWGPLATAGGVEPTYDRAANTCSSTYCHGATLSGGTETAPVWTDVDGEITCVSCHGYPPPPPHPANPACDQCHPGTLSGPGTIDRAGGQHIDGEVQLATGCTVCHGSEDGPAPPVDLSGSSDPTQIGVGAHQAHVEHAHIRAPLACGECHPAVQSVPGHIDGLPAEIAFGELANTNGANPEWNRATATCSSTYCHGATLAGGAETAPEWTDVGGVEHGCGSCHGAPPPPPHPQDQNCAGCHPGTVLPDGEIDVPGGLHINGQVDLPQGSCTVCHGGADGPAPPPDLSGSFDTDEIGVGAHQAHVEGGELRQGMACGQCHPDVDSVAGHIDGRPAEIVFDAGDLATEDGALPVWNRETETCSSTYCHGATLGGGGNKNPVWTTVDGTQAGCGQCHGFPPPAPHPQVFQCSGCHPETVLPDGSIDLEGGHHIDGVVDTPF